MEERLRGAWRRRPSTHPPETFAAGVMASVHSLEAKRQGALFGLPSLEPSIWRFAAVGWACTALFFFLFHQSAPESFSQTVGLLNDLAAGFDLGDLFGVI